MQDIQLENHPIERLIRIGEVRRLTGLGTTTLYRKVSANEFPRPVRLSVVARAWPLSEVQNWIAARIEGRGGNND
jgi:prophage regulatory protein